MKIIVTDEHCNICKQVKEQLKNDKSIRLVDINSKEGKALDKKLNIRAVPFGTNGTKECAIMTNNQNKIILNCRR